MGDEAAVAGPDRAEAQPTLGGSIGPWQREGEAHWPPSQVLLASSVPVLPLDGS